MVNRSEIRTVCRPECGVCDVGPPITVIYAVISSLTPIAAKRAVFFLSASSWVLAQSVVLAAAALVIDCFLTSLFLIAELDFYSVRVFVISVPIQTMPPADSSNSCCSSTGLVCFRSVTVTLYSCPLMLFFTIDRSCICALTLACASVRTRNKDRCPTW